MDQPLHTSEAALACLSRTWRRHLAVGCLRWRSLASDASHPTWNGGAAAVGQDLSQVQLLRSERSADVGGPNLARRRQLLQLPALEALELWAEQHLQAVAVARKGEELPRGWQLALHHEFQQGLTAAVRGLGMKIPGAWDPEADFAAMLTATDFGQSFPFYRFPMGMQDYYDPDPNIAAQNSYQQMKSACRHGCFIDGGELFDHKMFQLSLSEARGMDPTQRWCLECQYESLLQAGLTKKDLSGAYVGIMTG
eukprot:1513267-Amphidinium_carterae.1